MDKPEDRRDGHWQRMNPEMIKYNKNEIDGIIGVKRENKKPKKRGEFDASFKRALPILQKYVPKENMRQCRSVLRAAAFTYLAQSVVSVFRLKIILFSFINILKSIIRR